ncbi:hypothetical protein HZH66_013992 [Vespula vulgaris]|uniref:Uncharacterized protein n=1 Tax=Vespula vulgaris TaxID=7454 RepID=A0A834J467_VESVU|nr:hypothetical protein HZH66_013992 [Vespula vulgaris]
MLHRETIEFLERFHYAERWRKIYYCLIIRKKLLGQPNNYYKGTPKDTTVIESEKKQHSFEILIIWEIGQKLVKYWFEDVFFPEVERLSSKSAMLIA